MCADLCSAPSERSAEVVPFGRPTVDLTLRSRRTIDTTSATAHVSWPSGYTGSLTIGGQPADPSVPLDVRGSVGTQPSIRAVACITVQAHDSTEKCSEDQGTGDLRVPTLSGPRYVDQGCSYNPNGIGGPGDPSFNPCGSGRTFLFFWTLTTYGLPGGQMTDGYYSIRHGGYFAEDGWDPEVDGEFGRGGWTTLSSTTITLRFSIAGYGAVERVENLATPLCS